MLTGNQAALQQRQQLPSALAHNTFLPVIRTCPGQCIDEHGGREPAVIAWQVYQDADIHFPKQELNTFVPADATTAMDGICRTRTASPP
jgi:hypothetical protein